LPQGPEGPKGDTGASGKNGQTGPRGPAGKVQLITCTITTKVVKHKRVKVEKCVGKLVSGPIKITSTGVIRVSLSKAGRVVASGTLFHRRLVVQARRVLAPGIYRLTIRHGKPSQSLLIRLR
jgi:hypothetical protein